MSEYLLIVLLLGEILLRFLFYHVIWTAKFYYLPLIMFKRFLNHVIFFNSLSFSLTAPARENPFLVHSIFCLVRLRWSSAMLSIQNLQIIDVDKPLYNIIVQLHINFDNFFCLSNFSRRKNHFLFMMKSLEKRFYNNIISLMYVL